MKHIHPRKLIKVISYLEVQKQRSLTKFGNNKTPSRYLKGYQEGELDAYNTAILALQSLLTNNKDD
jgi:hypothetical protein